MFMTTERRKVGDVVALKQSHFKEQSKKASAEYHFIKSHMVQKPPGFVYLVNHMHVIM